MLCSGLCIVWHKARKSEQLTIKSRRESQKLWGYVMRSEDIIGDCIYTKIVIVWTTYWLNIAQMPWTAFYSTKRTRSGNGIYKNIRDHCNMDIISLNICFRLFLFVYNTSRLKFIHVCHATGHRYITADIILKKHMVTIGSRWHIIIPEKHVLLKLSRDIYSQ